MNCRSSFNRYRKGMHRFGVAGGGHHSDCHPDPTSDGRQPAAEQRDQSDWRWTPLPQELDGRTWQAVEADDWVSFDPCPYNSYCFYDDKRKKRMSTRRYESNSTQTQEDDMEYAEESDTLSVGPDNDGGVIDQRVNRSKVTEIGVTQSIDDAVDLKAELVKLGSDMDEVMKSNNHLAEEIADLREIMLAELPKKMVKAMADASLIIAPHENCFVIAAPSSSDQRSSIVSDEMSDVEFVSPDANGGQTKANLWLEGGDPTMAKVNDKEVVLKDTLGFNYTPEVDLNIWLDRG